MEIDWISNMCMAAVFRKDGSFTWFGKACVVFSAILVAAIVAAFSGCAYATEAT